MNRVRRVGIIGGTGPLGRGIAARLSYNYEVLIGSRDKTKASSAAEDLSRITSREVTGTTNSEAAGVGDVAILTLPEEVADHLLQDLKDQLAGKLVISPIVPMKFQGGRYIYTLTARSAAERVAALLKESRVAAAFHNLPAEMLLEVQRELHYSVLVAADSRDVFSEAASLVNSIKRLEPLYAGPLSSSRTIESLTPLLLNLGRLNRVKNPSIKIVS